MKNTVEASVISRSQSEISIEKGKLNLIHGTTSKLDSLFHVYDQVCNKSRLPDCIYLIAAFYLYFQVFFSSLYPFNRYWVRLNEDREIYTENSKIIKYLSILETIAWFFRVEDKKYDSSVEEPNGQTTLLPTAIFIFAVFSYSVLSATLEILGAFRIHAIKTFSFYNLRGGFTIVAPLMLLPCAAFFGISIRNLALGGSKISIFYLFFGCIMYFICTAYSYLGLIFLNQTTNFSFTCLSSFNTKIPLLLPIVSCISIISQCVFSIFDDWTTLIVQLSHIAISSLALFQIIYLVYHNKVGNILVIGIIISSWFNDIIFIILYFIPPPSRNNDGTVHNGFSFYYYSGFIVPLFFLVVSHIISYFFVTFRTKKMLKELTQLSDEIEDLYETTSNNNSKSPEESLLYNHKLFQNEQMALMSIHVSFLNCLPLFYKFTAINSTVALYPSTEVLMQIVHYLSFFPGASRQMNNVLSAVSKKRDLSYHHRFLLFQIYRIKTMRQTSVSNDANRKLAELKSRTNQVFEDVYSFWNSKTADIHYLDMISRENVKLDNKWDETIHDYPNFQKFSDEYCTYLVECQMNLKRAMVMKRRSNLMDLGKNFTVDVPFICLARNMPSYLELGIIDYHGNFKNKQKEKIGFNLTESSGNQTASLSSISGTSMNDNSKDSMSSNTTMLSNYKLDAEFEESIGRQLFKQSLLRLEMNRSLSVRHSYVSSLFLITGILSLIAGTVVFTSLYIYIDSYIDNRSDSMYYLNLASKSRFYLDLSILGSTIKFAYFTDRFNSLDKFNSLDSKDDYLMHFDDSISSSSYDANMFTINDKISDIFIHQNAQTSRKTFEQLLNDLSIRGENEDESIYETANLFVQNEVPFFSCFHSIPGQQIFLTLKGVQTYMYILVEQMASKDVDEITWFNSNEVCEMYANQPGLVNASSYLFQTLTKHEVNLCESKDKIINVFSFIFPFLPIILCFIPSMVFIYLFFKDTKKIINILLNVSDEAKEEAQKPIQKESSVEVVQPSEKKVKNIQWIILSIILFILCGVSAVIMYFLLSETKELNDDIKKLGRWNLLAATRMANTVETMNYALSAVILNGSSTFNLSSSPRLVSTRTNMLYLTRKSIIQLNNANEALLKGDEYASSCTGYDEELDRINTQLACEVIPNNTDLHDNYRCSSASQGIGLFISMIESFIDDIESTGGNFDNEMIIHSLHMLNRHLLERLEQAVDRIQDINSEMCKSLEKKLLAIFICGLVITVMIFIVVVIFYAKTIFIYGVAMFLAQRLPPSTFVSNKKLHNFIMNKKEMKDENTMSTSQSVIFMSLDAIVCTNSSGIIEIINPAVTSILGYTPDQMLGQNICAFFESFTEDENAQQKIEKKKESKDVNLSSDSEKISNQLELMKKGQSASVFEDHFHCLTDEKIIPCGVTILAMTGNDSSNVESFVFILRDETQLVKQQKEAEAAKAQSENLLFQILPRDIVTRLNSGEKDISFTVQSATIIFTDVVKFSEYASGLSPQEIMGSLSMMFAAFDTCAKKYDLITKIKLIGDIYMAAGGLFADEKVTQKDHALQILKFGLDCLVVLDEINIKLNALLQLRVGVNSGGPLLAGVLGTDKPVFDIIGDPINVAARLQTTDLPGKVQIPKSTYDLVCDEDFQIEERGEVFLKGKGKTIAYLVSPSSNLHTLSDSSISIPNA